ncbi:hypothetical protein D3C83_280840 [compost metagenome]
MVLKFCRVQVTRPPGERLNPEVEGPQSGLAIEPGNGSRNGPVLDRKLPGPVMNT